MTTLEKIRAEIDEQTEIHSDGEFYIKNFDVKRIIDKYAEQEPCDKCAMKNSNSNYCKNCMVAEYNGKKVSVPTKFVEQEPCDDAISRQAVLDGIEELKQSPWATDKRNGFEYLITEALDIVADLCVKQEPSVRPQEQTKEEHIDVFEVANVPWMFLDNCANSGYYCSKCKKKLVKDGWSETVKKINFCPNCGAKMNEDNSN